MVAPAPLTHSSSEREVLDFIRRHCRFLSRYRDAVFSQLDGAAFLGLSCVNSHMIFPAFSDRERGMLLAIVDSMVTQWKETGYVEKKKIVTKDVRNSFCGDCINLYENCFLEHLIRLNRCRPSAIPGGAGECLRCRRRLICKDAPPIKMMVEPFQNWKVKDTTLWDTSNDNFLCYNSSYDFDYNAETQKSTAAAAITDGWYSDSRQKCAFYDERCGLCSCGPPCCSQCCQPVEPPPTTFAMAESLFASKPKDGSPTKSAGTGRNDWAPESPRTANSAGRPTPRDEDWHPGSTPITASIASKYSLPGTSSHPSHAAGQSTHKINKQTPEGSFASKFEDEVQSFESTY